MHLRASVLIWKYLRSRRKERRRWPLCAGILILSACGYDPTVADKGGQTETPIADTATPSTSPDDSLQPTETPDPPESPTVDPCPDQDKDGTCDQEDCAPEDPLTYPGASEICDGKDNNCDQEIPSGERDSDGDGHSSCQGDCDIDNPNFYPGAPELCDGKDNNCDGAIPSGEVSDVDRDGTVDCNDCEPTNPATAPGLPESCDGKDNNCDGIIPPDEVDRDGDTYLVCGGTKPADCNDQDPEIHPNAPEVCDGIDNDCTDGVPITELDQDQDGESQCEGDCNDLNAGEASYLLEICDGLDNDCANGPDDGFDEDGDDYVSCAHTDQAVADCNDQDSQVYPGAVEACDGQDTDCDGLIPDNELQDGDLDGSRSCEDCNDTSPTTYPGAPELCNNLDDNCDGDIDDGVAEGLGDVDGDGVIDCLDGDCPRWVAAGATASNPQGTYADPFGTVQNAINIADPNLCGNIFVRPGNYPESIRFYGKPLDVVSSLAGQAVLEGAGTSTVVRFDSGETQAAVLTGFLIRGGSGGTDTAYADGCGGGVLILNSSPTLLSNQITGNEATSGAGVCIVGVADPHLEDNIFSLNVASDSGGALFLDGGPSATLVLNRFSDNEALSGNGGGVFCGNMSNAGQMNGNTLTSNRAGSLGGGVYLGPLCSVDFLENNLEYNTAEKGGGIAVMPSDTTTRTIANGTISAGAADLGGGLYIGVGVGTVLLSGYVISGAEATLGGGIFLDAGAPADMTLVTLTGNTAHEDGGGLYISPESRIYVRSGEISSNTALRGAGIFADRASRASLGNDSSGVLSILSNVASGNGGGMYLNQLLRATDGSNIISLTTIQDNQALDGGGLTAVNCTLTFLTNSIRTNKASGGEGGGVLCEGDQKLNLGGNTLVNNEPKNQYNCQ